MALLTTVDHFADSCITRFIRFAFGALFVALLLCGPAQSAQDAGLDAYQPPWWPIQVKSWHGDYDPATKRPGHAATSLKGPRLEEWVPPEKTTPPVTIGVSFPHLKDSYWVAVNYGIIQEAKRLGVGIRLLEAGGYDNLAKQAAQVSSLAGSGVDGVILGSISYEGNNDLIRQLAEKSVPVVELVNDVSAPAVSAKALVSFFDMGFFAGEFVAEEAERRRLEQVRMLFLPGPQASGWAPETLEGFTKAMAYFPGNLEIVDVLWGDTGAATQSRLLEDALNIHPDVNFVVGNAVAAEVAPDILKKHSIPATVVATYIIPPLYDKIAKGLVAAAPSDLTVFQGRMAVDMMVRLLSGQTPGKDFPFRSGPFIPMITPDNISDFPYEGLFGPRGYEPVFELEPER